MSKVKQSNPNLAEGEIAVVHDEDGGSDAIVSFLLKNANTLTWVLVVAVALGIGYKQYLGWQTAKQANALSAVDAAKTPEALALAAAENEGSFAAEIARFRQAQGEFDAGKFKEAGERFAAFLVTYPASTFKARALLGQAMAVEAQGMNAEALPLFETAAKEAQGKDKLALGIANLGAGRTAAATGKTAQAETFYKLASASEANDGTADLAKAALKQISTP